MNTEDVSPEARQLLAEHDAGAIAEMYLAMLQRAEHVEGGHYMRYESAQNAARWIRTGSTT